jgi:MoxR-like ATPase
MLPADVVGTQIYNPAGGFTTRKGPVFANLVLADEINRAPAKVQAALLEAMQEKQVTIGGTTYHLAEPFLVLATQNPLEQEGTYPLPEAQLDRFMLNIMVDYPEEADEFEIVRRRPLAELDLAEQLITTRPNCRAPGAKRAPFVLKTLHGRLVGISRRRLNAVITGRARNRVEMRLHDRRATRPLTRVPLRRKLRGARLKFGNLRGR